MAPVFTFIPVAARRLAERRLAECPFVVARKITSGTSLVASARWFVLVRLHGGALVCCFPDGFSPFCVQ